MKVIDKGTIINGKKDTGQQSCCFPGICVLPSNRWICGFRAAPTKKGTAGQKALITYSDDEGKTWSAPIDSFVPPSVDGKPGLFRGVGLTALGGERVLATLCWVEHSDPSGLPTTALLHNGDILVVYYAGSCSDLTDIQWCRIREMNYE